jgi:hypothetical protein
VRPDLERDQEVGVHAHEQRHDREEHHERAVHRHQLDVVFRQDHAARRHRLRQHPAPRHRLARKAELPAHLHRQDPAHEQEEQAHEQELDADDLVVGGKDVLPDEAPVVVMRVRGMRRRGNACHGEASWAACFIQAS